jgi:hypothetical protein
VLALLGNTSAAVLALLGNELEVLALLPNQRALTSCATCCDTCCAQHVQTPLPAPHTNYFALAHTAALTHTLCIHVHPPRRRLHTRGKEGGKAEGKDEGCVCGGRGSPSLVFFRILRNKQQLSTSTNPSNPSCCPLILQTIRKIRK